MANGKAKGHHKTDTGGPPGDDGGMQVVLQGDAIAAGEDTATWISADLTVRHNGKVTIAKGDLLVWAAAEPSESGDFVFVLAEADAFVEGADFAKFVEGDWSYSDESGEYQLSTVTVFAIDHPGKGGGLKHKFIDKFIERHFDGGDWAIDVDGNQAGLAFQAEASGENTLVAVDAYALAVEDSLSQSSILVVAAVA